MIIVPVLYAASDDLLKKLNQFVKDGGHVVYTFKSGFSDENVKVRSSIQPGIINEACGISYSQFTIPQNVSLKNDPFGAGKDNKVETWMELITPTTAKVLAYYEHPSWGNYAAVTQNQFGKGTATYIGCMTTHSLTEKIIKNALEKANLWKTEQQFSFPIIIKSGVNQQGKNIRYIFNYSGVNQQVKYVFENGTELLSNQSITKDSALRLEAWGVKIIEEN
jgi:beta-galactosidase